MSENKDLQSAIEKLVAKRSALNIAIAELKALAGIPIDEEDSNQQGVDSPTVEKGNNGSSTPGEIKQDSFFNMTAAAAAKKYLNIIKQPEETVIIAKKLLGGGFLTQSKNFTASVHTALSRDNDFVRVQGKWGLTKWYPGKPKAKPGKSEKEEVSENDKS